MDRLGALAEQTAALTAALRDTDPGTALASCPGWTAADLCTHITAVHRWALAALDGACPPPYAEEPAGADDYAAAATALVARLAELPADTPCWTFNRSDQSTGFWLRRQLHEVSVHRWDLEQHQVAEQLAEDGIDEVVDFFLPRQRASGRATVPAGTVVIDAGERAWTLGEPDSAAAGHMATVRADPATLYLLLWGRKHLGSASVEGDMIWAKHFFEAALTP